jgi:hypothetical protein
MARSSKVYVVVLADQVAGAFTVKHEMRTWLEKRHIAFGVGDRIVACDDGVQQAPLAGRDITEEVLA